VKPARHFWPLGAKVMWNYAAEAASEWTKPGLDDELWLLSVRCLFGLSVIANAGGSCCLFAKWPRNKKYLFDFNFIWACFFEPLFGVHWDGRRRPLSRWVLLLITVLLLEHYFDNFQSVSQWARLNRSSRCGFQKFYDFALWLCV